MNYSVDGLAEKWNCQSILFTSLDTNAFIRDHKDGTAIKKAILQMPVIKANGLKVGAGKAIYYTPNGKPHIRLHPGLFDKNDSLFADRHNTFFHEIAHFVAYWAAKEHGHGFPWQYSLQHFGFTPNRCYDPIEHNYRGYKHRKETRAVQEIVTDLLGDFPNA